MRVIATSRGYDNVVVREAGEEFDMPKGAKGSWFVPIEGSPEKPAKGGKPKADSGRPTTVSELAKEQASTTDLA